MIDPQTQANKFIKNLAKEHPEGIDVIKMGDNIMRTLELAVQYGKWVLLENVQKESDSPTVKKENSPKKGKKKQVKCSSQNNSTTQSARITSSSPQTPSQSLVVKGTPRKAIISKNQVSPRKSNKNSSNETKSNPDYPAAWSDPVPYCVQSVVGVY